LSDLQLVISTYAGLEDVLAEEVRTLGGKDVEIHTRAVSCVGDMGFVYKANFSLRTALRVMIRISDFEVTNGDDIYNGVIATDWSKYMEVDQTLAVRCILNSGLFENNLFPALKAKDAIVDQFRKAHDRRPNVDKENPHLEVILFINKEKCQVLINSSGASLHLRGYRKEVDKAPLSEVLAAGIILLSEWEPHIPLVDFMCGSGTILIEAALIAAKIPPGTFRESFAFERWPGFDAELYKLIREKQMERITDTEVKLLGNELNKWVLEKAKANIEAAGVEDMITLHLGDFIDFEHGLKRGVVIINPPYGEKLNVDDLEKLYSDIGTRLKHHYTGFKAWIFTGSPEGAKAIGLRPNRRIKLFNGPLECRLLGFDIFEGKKSERYLKTEN
jgi:putative N6-adenine-specific DNA methylase